MSKKIMLTPKDCLYIEDIVTALCLTIKKTQLELKQVQDQKVIDHLNDICVRLNEQVETCVSIMEGSGS